MIPVIATSASKNVGYSALLKPIREMLPSRRNTLGHREVARGRRDSRRPILAEKFSAFVFKTLADPSSES